MIPPAAARRLLPLTFALLALGAFMPLRMIRWESHFGRLTETIVAPISHPMMWLSSQLLPSGKHRDESAELRHLEDELAQTQVEKFQALAENDQLRKMIKDLQAGHALDPEQVVQLRTVPVIGSGSESADGLLTIRAGTRQEVTQNTVAMAAGLQLLGRVISAGERTSTVAPITSKASGAMRALIMIDGTPNGLACTLLPVGDGTLAGDVEDRRDPGTGAPIEPQVGQEVRLSDATHWPRTAQMLLVGTVERIEPSPKQPLRKVVTVRPIVEELNRVSQVTLRIAPDMDDAAPPPVKPQRGKN